MSALGIKSFSISGVLHVSAALVVFGAAYCIIEETKSVDVAPQPVIDISGMSFSGTVTQESGSQPSGLVIPKFKPIPKIEKIDYSSVEDQSDEEPIKENKKVSSSAPRNTSPNKMSYDEFQSKHSQTPTGGSASQTKSPIVSSKQGKVGKVGFDKKSFVQGQGTSGNGIGSEALENAHPGFFNYLASVLHDACAGSNILTSGLILKVSLRINGAGVIDEVKISSGSGNNQFDRDVIKLVRGMRLQGVPSDVLNQWINVNFEVQ